MHIERKQGRNLTESKRAVIDDKHHLSGLAVDDEMAKALFRPEDYISPKQIYLVQKLSTRPMSSLLEVEWEQQNTAVAANLH